MTNDERPATPRPSEPSDASPGLAGRLSGWAALWRARSERTDAQTAVDTDESLRLPKPPGVFRLFFSRHRWVVDWCVVAVFALPSALYLVFRLTGHTAVSRVGVVSTGAVDLPGSIIAVVGFTAMTIALRFRRAHPVVLVAVVATCILLIVPFYGGTELVAVSFALYAVAVYASTRSAWIALAVIVLALAISALIDARGDLGQAIALSLTAGFIALVSTLVGINVGNRKRYVEALLDRAAQLARERDQQALLAAAAERARIAREMHDIVAHSLTVIVALADGADATAARDPERAREAVRQVAETGRVALADMRVVLGVLAEASPPVSEVLAVEIPVAPLPGHGDLHAAVEAFRGAGMNIRFTTAGAVPGDTGLELTVYRIVQEALTNSLRYAPDPKHAAVRVDYGAAEVRIEISDEGQAQVGVPSIGTGRGIIGMAERANAFGGTVEAGPTTAGGWRVRAVLPVKGVL